MRARLVSTIAVLAAVAAQAIALAAPAVADPGGNDGTVKIAEIDDVGTPGNDPHVSCTFTVEWYGFDSGAGIRSQVTFESQAPTDDAQITVTGDQDVFVGADAAGGGTDLDGREAYTLAFTGEPQAEQGFHVKMTADTAGSQGSTTKTKVFWVTPCTGTGSTGGQDSGQCEPLDSGVKVAPGDADAEHVTAPAGLLISGYCVRAGGAAFESGTLAQPVASMWLSHPAGGNLTHYSLSYVSASSTDPETPTEPETPTDPETPFDWDWEYDAPTCPALTVAYPSTIPSGQANDVNIRLETNLGQVSLNYHNNVGTWSGTTTFVYSQHASWPAGVTSYAVVWVQVGGTNYHWQGGVECRTDGDPSTLDMPQAVTEVTGFRTGSVTVRRGSTVAADSVAVAQAGGQDLSVERYVGGAWRATKSVDTSDRGTARVTFPRYTKRGIFTYRLSVPGTVARTGATTGTFTVRVR